MKALASLETWLAKAAVPKVVAHTSSNKPIPHKATKVSTKNFSGTDHHEAYVAHGMLADRAGRSGNGKLAAHHGAQRDYHRKMFEAHESLGHKIPSYDESQSNVKMGHLASVKKSTKVTVEPHPPEVADVDPKVIASMKKRLKAKPTPGKKVAIKDPMDDSVHMGVKKSADPLLNELGAWLAKAQMGVHMPSGKNSGNSPAGQATRSHASAGPTTGRKPRDKATAVAEHTRVLGEMRSMKKPNLPKAADCSDDDAPKKKKMHKALSELNQWLCKAGKGKKKKKIDKAGEGTAAVDTSMDSVDPVPMA